MIISKKIYTLSFAFANQQMYKLQDILDTSLYSNSTCENILYLHEIFSTYHILISQISVQVLNYMYM